MNKKQIALAKKEINEDDESRKLRLIKELKVCFKNHPFLRNLRTGDKKKFES